MTDEQEERREIEDYLKQHHLQAFLGDAVNEVVKARPDDPLVHLAEVLTSCSESAKQIQGVTVREMLDGEALSAFDVEILTCKGKFYGTKSARLVQEQQHADGGTDLLEAANDATNILSELLIGKDPAQQATVDKALAADLCVLEELKMAASIACCKAGAAQSGVSTSNHVAILRDIDDGRVPKLAISVVSGGKLASSTLWVQDILLVPTHDGVGLSETLRLATDVHNYLPDAARDVGQEPFQRGPRGAYCNSSGTFEQLMGCVSTAMESSGCEDQFEVWVDVRASQFVDAGGAGEGGKASAGDNNESEKLPYDLSAFSLAKPRTNVVDAEELLDIYLDWLQAYPIAAFIDPFVQDDAAQASELLRRGQEILTSKLNSQQERRSPAGDDTLGVEEPETSPEQLEAASVGEGAGRPLLRVVVHRGATTAEQLAILHEETAANAVLINATASSVSDCLALAAKATELGWHVGVGASSERDLEAEFMADMALGVRADCLILGGLRSIATSSACRRLARSIAPRI